MVDKTILAGFDLHFPYIHKPTLNIFIKLIDIIKPDIVLFGGDMLDYDYESISFFNHGKVKRVNEGNLSKDYKLFQEKVLNPIENKLQSDTERVWILGNHEFRVNRVLETNDTYQGLIELESNLDLDKWNIIPYRRHYKVNSNTCIIHGEYTSKYHSQRHLQVYNSNLYYGHLHTYQVFTQQTPVHRHPLKSTAIGCMGQTNPHYDDGMSNNWINQILIIHKDGNTLYDDVLTIIKNKCIYGNKTIEG